MKRIYVGLLLSTTACLAQAPTSIAGLTLRTDFSIDTGVVPAEQLAAVDFFPDGTFEAYFLAGRLLPSPKLSYGAPLTGSYTYNVTAPNMATLALNPSIGSIDALNFSSSSEGSIDSGLSITRFTGSFTLRSTGGEPSSSALVNMSVLVTVSQGSPVSFGFVIGGTSKLREVLIRAVGPTLGQFGITNYAANPVYKLNGGYPDGGNGLMPGEASGSGVQYDPLKPGIGWSDSAVSSSTLSVESARAGAFPLLPNSNDKADIYLLSPGAYTLTVAPFDASQEGAELLEIYEVE